MADFDAVIVGAGAGGGVAAYVLAAAGWKVALLEKGRNPFPTLEEPTLRGSLFGDDELKFRRGFAFHDPFIEPRTLRGSASEEAKVHRLQELGVAVGGGTNQYDGNSPRVQQADLRLKSTFGDVPGTTVVDWPLSYADLAGPYDEVERLIGVQGLAGSDPFAEGRGDYPMPPGAPTKACLLLVQGAQTLGLHPHPMPIAINSMPYRGRPACQNAGFCNITCPTNAKGSTGVTAIRDALATGNLTLLTEACVSGVELEPSGQRATGVRYLDAQGAPQVVTGRHVLLGLNAIETPRLLLESATASHPDGVGNSSGLVGRNLMFHIVFMAVGIFTEEVRSYRGRVSSHGFADWTVSDGTAGFVRGGYVELGGYIHPVDEGTSYPWPLHADLMKQGKFRRNISSATMMGEDLPQLTNRVDLDPKVRDVYGRAVARVTYARHAHDQAVVDTYLPRLEAVVKASGAESVLKVDPFLRDGELQTKHLLGTTRMGTDPAASVCDPFGRLHDVENVWVVDGGLFPTSTAFNPTLTQQALAWRTAKHLLTVTP